MQSLIIVPAYNEADNIIAVLEELRPHSSQFDVLVVNDGSSDATEALVASAGVRQAVLPCNLGYSRAVQTGLQYAVRHRYRSIVLFDADGQHRPSDIARLVEPLTAGETDVALGSRYLGNVQASSMPLGRRIGRWVFAEIASVLTGRTLSDTTSGFKAMTGEVAEELLRTQFVDMHSETLVYLARLGFRIKEIPIEVRTRAHGESMYTVMSHLTYPLETGLLVCLGWMAASLRKAARR
jgi:glycosyltransferase involved in cell wall biosynthesis